MAVICKTNIEIWSENFKKYRCCYIEEVTDKKYKLKIYTLFLIVFLGVKRKQILVRHLESSLTFKPPPGEMSEGRTAQSCDYTQILSRIYSTGGPLATSTFFFCRKYGDFIRSLTFSTEDNDKWCLRVHSNRVKKESTDYLSVYLVFLSCSKSHIWAKF